VEREMTAPVSPEDLRARGFRAKAALDEFLGPAMAPIKAEYLAALTELAANEPWSTAKITKLAVAQRRPGRAVGPRTQPRSRDRGPSRSPQALAVMETMNG
jgi:hypothetical protein